MTGKNNGNTAISNQETPKKAKGKPRGKPFTGKDDPRNNTAGQTSKKKLRWNKTISELIAAEGEKLQKGTIGENTFKLKKVEWLVKSLWKKAIDGEAWAVNTILERTEGKVTQPIDHGEIKLILARVITSDRPEEM